MNYDRLTSRLVLFGHLCMAALLLLAVYFAEERVLLIDSAYQLFHDINHESILINDRRYSMVLSQLLPWLLIKLHVPLRWVIVAYSAGFVMMAYGCYILAVHVLKKRAMGLLMVFSLLAMRATFFHCISETFQLMFFAPLLYACLESLDEGRRSWWLWALTVLVELAAFFIHPVSIFFIVFIVLHRWIDSGRFGLPQTVCVALLVACVAVKMLGGQSGHDESFIPTVETLSYAVQHFFRLNSIQFFYIHFPDFYLFPFLLWLLTLIGYARRRKWMRFVMCFAFVTGFFVMSVVVYWKGDGPIGMERTYLPLLFFIGLVFLHDELPALCRHRVPAVMVCALYVLLATVSLVRVGVSTRPYANRLAEIGTIAAQARAEGQHKLLVTRSTAEAIFPVNIWGLALESMLYTARDGAENTVTIYMEDDDFDRQDPLYDDTDAYVAVNWWKRWSVDELNPHYFRLPAQGYLELVKTEEGYRLAPLR